MLAVLRQQLTQHLPQQRDFLIGLSGGVDSVVLLHLFAQLPELNVRVVHIHHGLSPNADNWLAVCQALCRQYRMPLVSRKVCVRGEKGVEANARNARYHAISQLVHPNETVVTAHHLDDQAETFLLALKRGSGVKGLSAMQAVGYWQNVAIFRPLLGVSKAEIIAYAEQENLRWITDESNADNRFDRNFLRNQMLPKLHQRWTQFSQMVARSAQHCAEQQALLEELLAEELTRRIGEKQQLDISGFEQFSALKQRQLVRLWLEKCAVPMPSTAQLQAVISELIFAKRDKDPEVKLGDKRVRRFRQAIFLLDQQTPSHASITIPPNSEGEERVCSARLSITRTPHELICTFSGKSYRLALPAELCDQQLTLTFGHQGKVQEYGKPHREEMKKIWQRHGVPTWERHNTPLLFWEGQLLGVLIQS